MVVAHGAGVAPELGKAAEGGKHAVAFPRKEQGNRVAASEMKGDPVHLQRRAERVVSCQHDRAVGPAFHHKGAVAEHLPGRETVAPFLLQKKRLLTGHRGGTGHQGGK